MGISHEEVLEGLTRYARYDIPHTVVSRIAEAFDRWDAVRLYRQDTDTLRVEVRSDGLLNQLMAKREIAQVIVDHVPPGGFLIPSGIRGRFKHNLIKMGYPVHDLVGYDRRRPRRGSARANGVGTGLLAETVPGRGGGQLLGRGKPPGRSGHRGVPCGAGKTIVGMAVMARARTHTLILETHQRLCGPPVDGGAPDKTTVRREDIGEYTGSRKEIRPVTVTTYQMLTFRRTKDGPSNT